MPIKYKNKQLNITTHFNSEYVRKQLQTKILQIQKIDITYKN